MAQSNRLHFNQGRNHQSLLEYYTVLQLELSKKVLNKKIIYLDTKFWVLLRDGLLYPEKKILEKELLLLSESLFENGKCIFPITEDVFMEVMKQTDSTTLIATAQVIDKLSDGVILIDSKTRLHFEVRHFILTKQGKPFFETKHLVWSKLSYVLGFQSFYFPDFNPDDNLMFEKSFVDHVWDMTMTQYIQGIQSNTPDIDFQNFLNVNFAENLNKGKFAHQNEASNFQQMFMNEVAGAVDYYKEDLATIWEDINEYETGKALSEQEIKERRPKAASLMKNFILELFRLNEVGKAMPSIHIQAALHAAVRWDKNQKFQNHDFHDLNHATAALPYCDYFFTEKRLAHLVTQKLLGFDKLYNCEVKWTIKDAILSLKILAS